MQPLAHAVRGRASFCFSAPNLQANDTAREHTRFWGSRMAKKRTQRRWVRRVKTDSTHPPPRTFTGSASEIARKMARKDVSPKGLGSAIQMIQYFINRGGRGLTVTRRRELERAKRILQKRRTSGRSTHKRTVRRRRASRKSARKQTRRSHRT